MMPPGGSDRAKQLAMFAIRGTLEGKTPEQLADEYIEAMGWNAAPPPPTAPGQTPLHCCCGDPCIMCGSTIDLQTGERHMRTL